jgi:hypothetical protein
MLSAADQIKEEAGGNLGGGAVAKRLVVVVHGVGDPQPGDALSGLVSGYCISTGAELAGAPWAESIEDDSASGAGEFIQTFPVHRADTLDGAKTSRTRFVEVYWGDLSRVKGTLEGLLFGLIDLVFGIRHIVFASQQELLGARCGRPARPFRWLARWAASGALWLARGPILSLNILAAVVVLLFMGSTLTASADASVEYHTRGLLGIAVGGLLVATLGALLYFQARKLAWSTTTAEGMLAAGALCCVGFVYVYARNQALLTYSNFVELLTAFLSLLAGLMALAILAMLGASALTHLLGWLQSSRSDPHSRRAIGQSLIVINVSTILSSALFVLFVMMAWAFFADRLGASVVALRIKQGLHLFGLVWLSFLAVGMVYLILMARSWWSARALEGSAGAQPVFPRYIVNRWVVVALLISGLLWPTFFLPLAIKLECQSASQWPYLGGLCALQDAVWFQRLEGTLEQVEGWNRYAILASVVIASSLVFVRAHLGSALDIVIDVIAHFRRPERAVLQALRQAASRLGGKQDPPIGRVYWSNRASEAAWNRMVGRFRRVVDEVLRADDFESMTVLAHSQGTMIALEALGVIDIKRKANETSPRRITRKPGLHINLVTMGCPLMHLYEHYLPGKYGINASADSYVAKWLNIYRADDFVGREINNTSDSTFPVNCRVGARGHINYWTDREVLTYLTDPDNGAL